MAGRLIFSLLCASLGMIAWAEGLPDPTRPPVGVESPAETVLPAGPVLQLIRNLPGKRIAIISGQEVHVGSIVGDARVIQIEEDRVVLRGPEGKQTLLLFPGVEKRTVISKPEMKKSSPAPAAKASRKE